MIRKIVILILLFGCCFILRAQSHIRQGFHNELPISIGRDNIETYFEMLYARIPSGVPVFMPKDIKNLTIYCYDTHSEYGKRVKGTLRRTYDATYKEGKLRTLRKRGEGYINQYDFYGNHLRSYTSDIISNGDEKESSNYRFELSGRRYNSLRLGAIGGVYISEDFFRVASNTVYGSYYNISTHGTYAKVVETQWDCSKSYFIRKFSISTYNKCKDGFTALVNYPYTKGFSDCVSDESIRTKVTTYFINTIGLHTDIDPFECIRDGWFGEHYYEYECE